uniref:K Homology domain-containing protein n=1 Tax=Pyramimonas orientalis virus TaxID=455367 RepID=A0A7M3UNN7_POV01|nr:hypothetical protein HWQ62_00171 [Pyramimonas orientalis virus]
MVSIITTMPTFYKHVVVDIPHTYMRFVVGKKGVHLKKCCTSTGVDSVWFNMKRNVVEIYGPKDNLGKASGFLEKRMEKIKSKVPSDELATFNSTLQVNEDTCINGALTGALEKDEVKYLIGKKGKHFKRITKDASVSFIWYDEENHSVLIWGPQENLSMAIKLLFSQIEKVKEYNKTRSGEDTIMV